MLRYITLVVMTLSCSQVLAWSGNVNDSIAFGGPLKMGTPKSNEWQVKTYTMGGIDVDVTAASQTISITIPKYIPVLGIRANPMVYPGSGKAPQINFNNMINTSSISGGKATLRVPVLSTADNKKIGTLYVPLTTAAAFQHGGGGYTGVYDMVSRFSGNGFFGGLTTDYKKMYPAGQAVSLANKFDTTITSGFNKVGNNHRGSGVTSFDGYSWDATGNIVGRNLSYYTAFYIAGIQQGELMNIELSNPVGGSVEWKANIPVTVSYR